MKPISLMDAMATLFGSEYVQQVTFIVHYGSRDETRDVDLLVVQDQSFPSTLSLLGKFDALTISLDQFEELGALADPLVTEPLLTGTLLFGKEAEWNARRSRFTRTPVNDSCARHAARRALKEMYSAFWLVADCAIKPPNPLFDPASVPQYAHV